MRVSRSPAWVAALLVLFGRTAGGTAGEPPLPVALQVDLLLKVAPYDRNLPARAAQRVQTLVVVKADSDESVRAGAQALQLLSGRTEVAGRPHAAESWAFTGAEALAEQCRSRKVSIVYLSPGFTDAESSEIGKKLEGLSLLSAAAEPSAVGRGVVLGFDLVSGKPRLVVSLERAGKQSVALSANVLKLMTVIP